MEARRSLLFFEEYLTSWEGDKWRWTDREERKRRGGIGDVCGRERDEVMRAFRARVVQECLDRNREVR
jgi:hypothetical protein